MIKLPYNTIKFGVQLRQLRCQQNMTLEHLSNISGISINTIRKLERGDISCRIETLCILSFYLKTDLIKSLIDTPDPKFEQINKIQSHILDDLSKHLYINLSCYIHDLESIYSSIAYISDNPFYDELFNLIEKLLLWTRGILAYVGRDYPSAVSFFYDALTIDNNDFPAASQTFFPKKENDYPIYTSLLIAYLHNDTIEGFDPLIQRFNALLLHSFYNYESLYIELNFEYAYYYLLKSNTHLCLDIVDNSLENIRKYTSSFERSQVGKLLLLRSILLYTLVPGTSIHEIYLACDRMLYENNEHLLRLLIQSLSVYYPLSFDHPKYKQYMKD